MRQRFILLIIFGFLPSVIFAQLWADLISRESNTPDDSLSFGVSLSYENMISKTEGRDYSSGSGKSLSYINPSLGMEMACDITARSAKGIHVLVGWEGFYAFDHLMTRAKIGAMYHAWIAGVMVAKRVVSDKEGIYFSRRGSFRHDITVGLFLEQHRDFLTLSLYGECSKNETYHFVEVSKCLSNYPRFWVAVSSESLKGYGPRVYYKIRNKPLSFHLAMNIAPPMYREYTNVSNSLEFGLKQVFY